MNWTAFIAGAARVLDLFGTMSEPVDLPATLRGLLSRTGDCPAPDNAADRDSGTTGSV